MTCNNRQAGMFSDAGPRTTPETPSGQTSAWLTAARAGHCAAPSSPVFQSGRTRLDGNTMAILKQTQERASTLKNQFVASTPHTHGWFHVPAHLTTCSFRHVVCTDVREENPKRMKEDNEGDVFCCCFFEYCNNY